MKNFYLHTIAPIFKFERAAKLFLWMTIINGIIFSAWMLFFNFYMLEAGQSRDFLGLVNSVPSIAALIFGVPIGWLADRLRPRRAMIIGMVIATLAMAVEVTTTSQTIILAAAFIQGMANTLLIVSQAPLMMRLSSGDSRTLLFSLNFGLQTLAGAVGSLFAGQLPAVFGAWLGVTAKSAGAYQAVLIASLILGATALVPLFMMREPQYSPAPKNSDKGQLRFTKELIELIIVTAKLIAPQMLIGFGAAILIPYMNVFFRERHAISDETLGVMFGLSALVTGLGSLIGPRLAARLGGKINAVVATQFTSLVFLALVGFSPFLWLAIVAFLVRGALMNMSSPLYNAFALEQIPEREQGIVNSVMSVSWSLGWAVGPYISGLVQETYGFAPLFVATSVLYFTAVVLIWLFFGRKSAIDKRGQPAGAA
jgi:MFS family permease